MNRNELMFLAVSLGLAAYTGNVSAQSANLQHKVGPKIGKTEPNTEATPQTQKDNESDLPYIDPALDSMLTAFSTQKVDEVVVVGYGTQHRTQLTGAVTKVNSQVFDLSTAPTLDGGLSGAVAGLNITASSGQPGAASTFRIRGGNSVNASNEPLYVIDGFIYYKDASAGKTGLGAIESSLNPLSTVNPSDIESVEVLKDVSATAIYGSRGANGVIIITTKKGKRGKTSINYRATAGFDFVSKKLDLMTAKEWAGFQKKYYNNKGGYTDARRCCKRP